MIVIPSIELSDLLASNTRRIDSMTDCYLLIAEISAGQVPSIIAVRDDLIKVLGLNEVSCKVLKENALGQSINFPFTDLYTSLEFIDFETYKSEIEAKKPDVNDEDMEDQDESSRSQDSE